MAIEALRTPDARFSMLPAYPYAPHYVQLSVVRTLSCT